RRAVAPCRLGLGSHPRRHAPACHRQSEGLGGRQEAAHAGAGDAVAAAAQVRKVGMRRCLLVFAFALAGLPGAVAQTAAPPSDAVNSMLGGWEMSNADRDKTCIITFKLDAAGPGRALDLPKDCTTTFPNIKDVVAWTIDNDALRLIDARGTTLLEFNE